MDMETNDRQYPSADTNRLICQIIALDAKHACENATGLSVDTENGRKCVQLAIKAARTAVKWRRDYYLKQLALIAGQNAADKFLTRYKTCFTYSLIHDYGMKLCDGNKGQVSSNISECVNTSEFYLRDVGPLSSCVQFLSTAVKARVERNRASIIEHNKKNLLVTKEALTRAVELANIYASLYWTAEFIHLSDDSQTAVFKCSRQNESGSISSTEVILSVRPDLDYEKRTECSCGEKYQHPGGCGHVCYVLQIFIPTVRNSLPRTFRGYLPWWFDEVYHVST
jgi:hypothetical protein